MFRKVALVGVVAVLALSGCAAPTLRGGEVSGITGIERDPGGGMSALVNVCEGTIDGFALDEGDGFWRLATPATGFGYVTLDGGPDFTDPLSPGVSYELLGYSDDKTVMTTPVAFTVADVEALDEGEVLYSTGSGIVTGSEDDFKAAGCAD